MKVQEKGSDLSSNLSDPNSYYLFRPKVWKIDMVARCVGRTTNLIDAERIAESYELKGFEVEVVKKNQGNISFYEVWVGKEPQIKS